MYRYAYLPPSKLIIVLFDGSCGTWLMTFERLLPGDDSAFDSTEHLPILPPLPPRPMVMRAIIAITNENVKLTEIDTLSDICKQKDKVYILHLVVIG